MRDWTNAGSGNPAPRRIYRGHMASETLTAIQSIKLEVQEIRTMLNTYMDKVDKHDKILISGEGDRLPLAEIVRNLSKVIGDYIAQKDKEEQIKQDEWRKIKISLILAGIPLLLTFVGQAIIFYFRVLPIIENIPTK